MKTAAEKIPTHESFKELIVWCELARAAFIAAVNPASPPSLNSLKESLAAAHTKMSDELRQWLAAHASDSLRADPDRAPDGPWAQVAEAMASNNEQVALAACWLMQRAVGAAYYRVAAALPAEPSARDLVHQLVRNLEAIRTSTGQLQSEIREAADMATSKCPFFHALAHAS